MEKFKVCVAVHLLIIKDNKILLERSIKPDKNYYMNLVIPSGHLKEGENVEEAMIREAKEELGIDLKEFELVQIMNVNGFSDVYDCYFFLCKNYDGELINNEPDYTKGLEWHSLEKPIENFMEYQAYALEKYKESPNLSFSMYGWNVNK